MSDHDPDVIVLAAANGQSKREIAAAYGITETEVQTIIGREAQRCMEGEWLRREWLLEARRLRELGQKYYNKAMAGDGDIHAAAVYIKASERLATLSGMNHPIGYAVQLVQRDPPAQPTSTELIRRALDRVCGELPSPSEPQDDPPATQ